MVNQYHRNLGHPSRREFLKVLKAGHAKPAVLEYVRREHRCADCDAHTKPQPSRKAAIPRTCEFNHIIALDVFFIPLRGQSLPILNIICHDTNFQVAAPHATRRGLPQLQWCWSTCQVSWQRYFGTPDVRITDGGPEFRCDFTKHELDWYSQHLKSWQDGWWHDQRWTQTPVVGSWWDDAKLLWDF